MKTIIVLSALASIALAAPAPLGDGLKPTQEILWPKSIKRERRSPTFGKLGHEHGSHIILHEPVHHHIIEESHHHGYQPAYGHGHHYGHYRSQEEGVAIENSQEICAKEVEAKCGQREDANESTELKHSATAENNLESNIIMARTAVENIQHNLDEMEKTASARASLKHAKSESDIALHENIDTARAALEHVQKSFNGLHSIKQHANAPKEADTENLEKMSEEERMAHWKEAIENIQKNVEIANNIKDSFRFTSKDEEKTVTSGTSSAIIGQHRDKMEAEKNHALEKKTEENKMETSASHSKKVILKTEAEENNFQKHSIKEEGKSQIKSSNIDAEEHLTINKNVESKNENEDVLLEQGKNVESSAMSMKSSEHNKELHHDIDTKKIAKLDIEVKNKHNLAGKAVETTNVKTEQKEIQQQRWHHDNRGDHLTHGKNTAAREDINEGSFKVEEKNTHIDSTNFLKNINHDTESQDFSKAREDFKEKSAHIDSVKLNMKTDQMKMSNENAHLNTESMKIIEHQDIGKSREHDRKSSLLVNGHTNLESRKASEDMMHHESAPVASVVLMKSAVTEVGNQNMKEQSAISPKESEKSQINLEKGKNVEEMKTGTVPENIQLESKSSINIPQHHAMGTESLKDAEFVQTRKSEAELNTNQKTSMKSVDHLKNKHNAAFEHSLKPKDSMTKIGKSADMDLDLNLMRNTAGKAAMENNNGWSKSHHHNSARFAYGPSVAASPSGGYGGSAAVASSSAGAGHSPGSAGAVGVFPHADVGGCAVPLLLSCSPSVVTGTLAKAHSTGEYGAAASSSHAVAASASAAAYVAPAYRSSEGFNFHNKRDTKKISFITKPRRTPTINLQKIPASNRY